MTLLKLWWVYLVRCSDNSLYCGITTNMHRRMVAHNNGEGAKYTKTRRPVYLMWYRTVKGRSIASKLEGKIKTLSKSRKEFLVRENLGEEIIEEWNR